MSPNGPYVERGQREGRVNIGSSGTASGGHFQWMDTAVTAPDYPDLPGAFPGNSGQFYSYRDAANLYLAVNVTDALAVTVPFGSSSRRDSVEFRVFADGLNNHTYVHGGLNNSDLLFVSVQRDTAHALINQSDSDWNPVMGTDWSASTTATGSGFTAILRLSLATLANALPDTGNYSVNVVLKDQDVDLIASPSNDNDDNNRVWLSGADTSTVNDTTAFRNQLQNSMSWALLSVPEPAFGGVGTMALVALGGGIYARRCFRK